MALLEDIEHLIPGHHDAHQIGGLRQVRHTRIGLRPHDFVITRVHGINPDPVFGLERGSQKPPAILHPRRRAHDRNGARVEHFVDRRHLRFCPEFHDTPSKAWSSGRQAHALRTGLPSADIPASLAEAERLRQSLLADAGRGDLLKTIIDRSSSVRTEGSKEKWPEPKFRPSLNREASRLGDVRVRRPSSRAQVPETCRDQLDRVASKMHF